MIFSGKVALYETDLGVYFEIIELVVAQPFFDDLRVILFGAIREIQEYEVVLCPLYCLNFVNNIIFSHGLL